MIDFGQPVPEMTRLRISVLGGITVAVDPAGVLALPGGRAQALLGYLAMHAGRAQQRDAVAALLWPDAMRERARHNLRQLLLLLRRALPEGALQEVGDSLALRADGLDIDACEFQQLASHDDPAALDRAADLYRGDLLAGLTEQSADFEQWLLAERERLRELALVTLARLLAAYTEASAVDRAIQIAHRLVAIEPTHEAVYRTLMRLYARQGRRAAALKQYQICVATLQRELGTEPEAETKQVYRELLQQREQMPVRSPEPIESRAARAHSTRMQDVPVRETPLIGRGFEMEQIRRALDERPSRGGRAVLVVGEAGIGKTRLIEELIAERLQAGGRAIVGRCYESTQILPFGPWVDGLRTSRLAEEEQVIWRLPPIWRAELARLLPEVASDDLPSPSDDYLRLFESVAQLIDRLNTSAPVMFVLEDVHWADEMTLRLLSYIIRREAGLPVLAATVREEELADASALQRTLRELEADARVVAVKLLPLSRGDTTSLVRALTRAGCDPHDFDEQIWHASEGNPLMAVETMRALQEGGSGEVAVGALPLPQRVREVVAGRLDRLSAEGRRLATAAAVIGREFDFALLQRAVLLSEWQAAEAVEELVRRRILRGVGEGFDFTHDHIRDFVYSQTLPAYRRFLHARVATTIEALHADNLEPHCAAIGRHYEEAEIWGRAVTYLRRAGTQAAARSAHAQAVTYFDRAVDALQHLPHSDETLTHAIDLRFDLRTSFVALGNFDRVLASLREAEALVADLGDRRRAGWVSVYMAHYFLMTADFAEAEAHARRASEIGDAVDDRPLGIGSTHYLGWARLARGDHAGAEHCFHTVLQSLEGDRARDRCGLTGFPSVMARWLLATSLADRGEFSQALTYADEAIRMSNALDHAFSRILAFWARAYVFGIKGDVAEAVSGFEQSLAVAREFNIHFLTPFVMAHLGAAQSRAGRVAEGLARIDEALRVFDRSPYRVFHSLFVAYRAEAFLRGERREDAMDSASRALALARDRGERGSEAEALRILGEISSTATDVDAGQALSFFKEALALAEQLDMRPLAAKCHRRLSDSAVP